MKKKKLTAAIVGVSAIAFIALILFLLVVKLLWAWTVPDLFPGAVKQGLVAESISLSAAFKLSLFIALLLGLARGARVKT